MGKIATLVPRNIAQMVQRKNLTTRQLSEPIAAKKSRMPTFGFASELHNATGAAEDRFVDRFVGQL